MGKEVVGRILRAFAYVLLAIGTTGIKAQEEGTPPNGASCVVSAGNRSAPLAADGGYAIFGIPGNLGAIRARATCSDGSVGQSEIAFTNPLEAATVQLGRIVFGRLDPVPIAATLSAAQRYLGTGDTSQLSLLAVAADGSSHDATPRSAGTVYAMSNALMATVSENGLVRIYPQFAPGSSARVVASATTEGSVSSTFQYVLGPRGTLIGRVVRADGSSIVAGAQVSVLRLQPMEQAGIAVTDIQGRFQLQDVSAGPFLVSAIDPATGDRASGSARIETEGQTADVTLTLNGQGSVDVTVVDAGDTGVANATVTFTALGGQREVRTLETNAQGLARFAAVPSGQFTVSTRDPATRLVGIATASVAVGQTLPITLKQQPIGQVDGAVYDVDGSTRREGVQVRILSRERGILTQTVTAADAAFRFDTLPISDGPFTLDAFVDGRLRARVPGIVISQPNETVTRDIVLGAVGTVTGTVRDTSGSRFANARVTLQSLVGLRLSFDVHADESGRFVLPAVPVGEFELTALTTNGRSGRAQGRVVADGETVALDVVIADNALVGTVFQRDGATPAGAGVAVYLAPRSLGVHYSYEPLYGVGNNGIQRTTTDAQGRFAFAIASANAYYIQAEQGLDRGRSETVIVNLDPGQPLEARITFLAKGNLSGIVRDATGSVQPNVPVQVRTQGAFTAERTTTTDAQGRYALDGVFAGDIAVSARNEATRLAGVATGRLDREGQAVAIDVTLAASGALHGRVLQRDGSVVAGPVRLMAKRQGAVFASLELDSGQSYEFDLVPVGEVELDAEALDTGDRGVAVTQLSAGETKTVDVRLVGQGSLLVHVADEAGQSVAGARITTSSQYPFPDTREGVSDANGDVLFARVFAGDFRVAANKPAPIGALSGSASGTLLPGESKLVEITMSARQVGRVQGKVVRPDGITPVGAGLVVRMLPEPYPNAFVTQTDAQGLFAFDPVEAGSYTIDALNFYTPNGCPPRDRVRGRTTNVTVAQQGETAQATIQLIGQGRVSGTISDAQGTPAAGIQVTLTNPDPVYGANVTCNGRTTYDRVTDADGRYSVDDAPPGDFTIVASNTSGSRRAQGAGRVRFDGDAVVVDLTLVEAAVTMPYTLYDANGFRFDIAGNGAVGNGTNNVFGSAAPDNGGLRLELVRDGVAVPFTNGDGTIGHLDQNGQEVAVDDITPSGLTVTRRIYTPRAGYFTRYLEVLRNDTAQPVTVDLRVKSHHRAANSNPRVVDTSDGDQILSVANPAAPDRWAVIDDQVDGDPFVSSSIPATGHLFDGDGGATQVAVATYELIGQTGRLTYAWNAITVPPGESVAFLHFVLNQLDRYSAREAAMRLVRLPPEAIDDLSAGDRQAIRNFAVPAQSTLAPLPNLDAGVVSGRVFSGDGVTSIEGARVRFKSLHALFGRERFGTTSTDGSFLFRSTLDGSIDNAVIPVYGFELSATHPRSGATTALTPGEFESGQTQARQDLIFVSRGDVRGTVKRHNGAVVAQARVNLCRLDDRIRCSDELPNPVNWAESGDDGRYLMTANRPRDYFLFASKRHPQAGSSPRDILGRGTVTITAGDTAVMDVVMEPTGSISGIVLAADRTPIANATVDLYVQDQSGVGRTTRSDTAGRYRLFDVPLGTHRVVARDAISQAEGFADATVAVDQDSVADITLRGFGAITAHVLFARGVPAGNATVWADIYHPAQRTDSNGATRFQLPTGSYHLIAQHPDSSNVSLRGSADAALVSIGEQVDATITLPPAGTVRGTIVRPDGTTLANGFPYTIAQIRGGANEYRSGNTSATGAYRAAGLPLGGYVITAYDAQQDRFADAEFDVEQDGQEVDVDLTLLDNRIALPASLYDANRFQFDVQRSGALPHGSGAFNSAGALLSIDGENYSGDSSARLEAQRRQFAITQPTLLRGLKVTRKVYVPRGAYFARYLEILENPTGTPISADVALTSQFAGGGVLTTSSGDSAVTAADRWLIVDDTEDGDVLLGDAQPVSAQVFAGGGTAGQPDVVNLVTVDGKPRLTVRWPGLSVPAGGRVALMHFVVQQINRRGAQAAAERLAQLPPEVLTDLGDADVAGLLNFELPPGLVSTLEPLPALTASLRGTTYEGDQRTPIGNARITVQSSHPLFNRVWGVQRDPFFGCPPGTPVGSLVSVATSGGGANPPAVGSYLLQGQLTATDSIALPEGVEVRVTAQEARSCFGFYSGHPFTRHPSRVTTPAPSATQDVIYDTGVLTGSVVGDGNHSITGGRLYRSTDDPDALYPVYVPIRNDATYVYPGLPPGSYDLLFDTAAPNAVLGDGGLRGSRKSVQVSLGQITVTDVSMQETARVDGTVTTANGEPARNARLTLRGPAAGQQYDQCASGCVVETLGKHKGKRDVVREMSTDSLGRYNFVAVPSGEYTLTAVDPVSGGRRSLPLSVATDPVTLPITLLAVGSADVTVVGVAGTPVVDAFVYLRPEGLAEEVAGRTDGQGRLTVANIPQGGYELRVRDPRYPDQRFMDRRAVGSIASGGQRDTHVIALFAAAKLALSVVDGDSGGAAVANASVYVTDVGGSRYVGATNAQGRLDIVPVPEGAYTVRARARVGGIDKEDQVDGTIAAADDQRTLPIRVDLRSLVVPLPAMIYDANRVAYRIGTDGSGSGLPTLEISGNAFTGASTATQQLGRRQYTVAQPAALAGLQVRRQVYVPRNGYFARYVEILENTGGAPVSVDVRLSETVDPSWVVLDTSSDDGVLDVSDRWFSFGSYLSDGGSTVLHDGVPLNGLAAPTGTQYHYTIDVPPGMGNLSVRTSGGSGDADLYVRFGAPPTTSSYDCRGYNSGNNELCSFAAPQAGTWHVMVHAYAAYTGVSLTASYGASAPVARTPPDGTNVAKEPSVGLAAAWPLSTPTWALVPSGEGTTLSAPQLGFDRVGNANVASATWTGLTIPAGQRVALMHFAVLQLGPAAAKAAAQRLAQLPPETLDGLDAELIGTIGNFAVPTDGLSALPPLPPLEGALSGFVYEGDGSTPAAASRVSVRSQNPLFGRVYTTNDAGTLTADAVGAYSIRGSVRDDSFTIAIPVDAPLTIQAENADSSLQAQATAMFPPGESAATQNLQLASGQIAGQVTGAYQYAAPYGGSVRAYVGATQRAWTWIQPDGSFRIGGLPAGDYRLDVDFTVREGSNLTTSVPSVTVVSGQVAQRTITLAPNGAVSGRVLSGSGVGVGQQYVILSNSGISRAVYADAQGAFAFGAVPIGTYSLKTTDQRTGSDVVFQVDVQQNQTASQNLVLPGLGTVTITTRYARGALASGVDLYLQSPTINGRRYLGSTSGNATLSTQIAVGPYTIVARHPVTGVQSETSGAVANDGELSALSVTLKAAATLRVLVVDADAGSAPLAGARVQYRASAADPWSSTYTTASDGRTLLGTLSEGTYTVRATATDGRATDAAVAVDAGMDGQTIERTVSVSISMDHVDLLTFDQESHLYGVSMNAGDRLSVAVRGVATGQFDGNCRVRVQVYSPGGTRLASGYGYGPANNFVQVNDYNDLRNVVAQAGGFHVVAISAYDQGWCYQGGYYLKTSVNDVAVQPQPYQGGGEVRGHFYRPDGATPIAGAAVRLRIDSEPRLHVGVTTDAAGAFAFANVPDRWFRLYSLPIDGTSTETSSYAVAGETTVRDLVLPAQTRLNLQALHDDGSPYAESLSYLIQGGANGNYSGVTDAQGRATVLYTSSQPALVTIYGPGGWNDRGEALAPVADGQTVEVPVRIGAAAVRGRVFDAGGALAPDVYVFVQRVAPREHLGGTGSDAQGAFTIDRLPGGALVDLRAQDPFSNLMIAKRVQLLAGQTIEQDMHLPRRGSIQGRVLHRRGTPIGGADVAASYVYDDIDGSTTWRSAYTDAQGHYRLDELPLGREIHLEVRKSGGGQTYTETRTVVLTEAEPDAQADFTLDIAGGSVHVRFEAADGVPMAGYCNVTLSAANEYYDWFYGDCADGAAFEGVPVGSVTVSGSRWCSGGARVEQASTAPGPSCSYAEFAPVTVEVGDGESVDVPFFQSVIKGSVRFSDGMAAPYSSVWLIDVDGRNYSTAAAEDGSYRFDVVPQGAFELEAQDDASGLHVTQAGTLVDPAVPVIVDLTLPPSGHIAGVVRDAEGVPVAQAVAYATSSGLDLDRSTETGADGTFRFDRIALGDVALSALHPQTQNVAVASATLSGEGQSASVELVFPRTGSLVGAVTRPDGAAAANACISLWSTAEGVAYQDVLLSTLADEQGRYAFPVALPGPVVVHAECADEQVGLAAAQIASDAETTLDVTLGNAENLWKTLIDGLSDYVIEVSGSGQIWAEHQSPYFYTLGAAFALRVDGRAFPDRPAAHVALDGRELVYEPTTLSGLRVARRVHVPEMGGYVRFLESLSNPTTQDITVHVELSGEFSGIATLKIPPSSTGNRYAMQVAHDGDTEVGSAYVFAGNGLTPERIEIDDGQSGFGWGWTVTVPAGQTRSFVSYAVSRYGEQGGAAQAQAANLADQIQSGMFDGLSVEDKAAIQNFTVP